MKKTYTLYKTWYIPFLIIVRSRVILFRMFFKPLRLLNTLQQISQQLWWTTRCSLHNAWLLKYFFTDIALDPRKFVTGCRVDFCFLPRCLILTSWHVGFMRLHILRHRLFQTETREQKKSEKNVCFYLVELDKRNDQIMLRKQSYNL